MDVARDEIHHGRRYDSTIIRMLLILTTLVFAQVCSFDFVLWDDNVYILDNPTLRHGLTGEGIRQVWTSLMMSHWHPITMLSHMADVTLFGMRPGAHHAVNLALHLANTLLLFTLLRSLTNAPWCSAFVAAVFAVHPLHVETVVWVSDRKDLLSTFFGFLALHAYRRAVTEGRIRWHACLVILLALALLSKSMWVTLPVMCLLLDYWPLRRLQWRRPRDRIAGPQLGDSTANVATPARLIAEKAAPILVVMIFGTLTVLVLRRTAMVDYFGRLPRRLCLANGVASYGWYIVKTLWPTRLAVQYWHPYLPAGTPWATWHLVGSALLLLGISLVVWRLRRPYLTMGWLWFLGILLPVSGVLQLGKHGRADRYMYVPMIGLLIMVAWGTREAIGRWGHQSTAVKRVAATMAVVVVLACAIGSYRQARRWKDSMTFLRYQLSVVPNDPDFNTNMGFLLKRQGKDELAIQYAERAVAIDPDVAPAHRLLSRIYRERDDHKAANEHAKIANQLAEKMRRLQSSK